MTTLYGGPMPPDFTDGEQLTAAGFNAVKNYWIVDGELPETAGDGDVVFSIGEAFTPELPGVGGWSDVSEVESPDIDVPVYTDSEGIHWKTYIWENPQGYDCRQVLPPLIVNWRLSGWHSPNEGLIEVIVCGGGVQDSAMAGARHKRNYQVLLFIHQLVRRSMLGQAVKAQPQALLAVKRRPNRYGQLAHIVQAVTQAMDSLVSMEQHLAQEQLVVVLVVAKMVNGNLAQA